MPVTATLSRESYDRFGDKVANELVEWFNQVDAAYRADLREMNELNFARFDATQARRFAESEARWAERTAQWDRRFAEQDARWEQRLAQMDVKWEQRFAQMDVRMAGLETRLIRWMFLFWVTNLAAAVGLARLHP